MTTPIDPYPTFDCLAAEVDTVVAVGKEVIIVGDPSCVTVVVGPPREKLNVLEAVALAENEAVTERLREEMLVPLQKLL